MQLIIFGPPGAGKDTYSKMLEGDCNLYHFCMGDELRKARENNGDLHDIMEKGDLVPDKYVCELVKSQLKGRNNYILNGFPRNIAQCLWLENELKTKIDVFIDLQVDEDVLISRLVKPGGRGREDDKQEVVNHRLKVFREQTQPVWQYLCARTNHIQINGNGSIEEVYSLIREELKSFTF